MKAKEEGLDCDKLPKGHGAFGSATNPIPVDGPEGEIRYLARLRSKTGRALMFHRVGRSESEVAANALDIYEVVAADGTQWGTLFFDMYHPRPSTVAPPDFTLRPPGPSLSPTAEFGYGTNQKVEDFPFGLPAVRAAE